MLYIILNPLFFWEENMILNFVVENFMSIKEAQQISFQVTKKDKLNDSVRAYNSQFCNTIMAVLGNNASGKTNALKALSFLLWFVKHSYHYNDSLTSMVVPHALSRDKVSKFELEFEKNGVEYVYKLHLTNEYVEYESLGTKLSPRSTCLYEIQRQGDGLHLTKWNTKMGKLNASDKDRFLKMPRPCAFFSFLLGTGYIDASFPQLKPLYSYDTNVGPIGEGTEDHFQIVLRESASLKNDEKQRNKIERFLSECDLGFFGFSFQKGVIEKSPNEKQEIDILSIKHIADKRAFILSLIQESNGTQKLIRLLDRVFKILDRGGILVFDEIEDALHPVFVCKIINMFKSMEVNPNNAQLLFTTHSPLLLEECTKTQIYLVEKNQQLVSELFRLDEVEGVRNCDNFCAKYLAGTYGGVPKGRWL